MGGGHIGRRSIKLQVAGEQYGRAGSAESAHERMWLKMQVEDYSQPAVHCSAPVDVQGRYSPVLNGRFQRLPALIPTGLLSNFSGQSLCQFECKLRVIRLLCADLHLAKPAVHFASVCVKRFRRV
jgi:hypothetical protein